ncbi:hypothetical protein JQX13_25125 [Archangium violaceum]|nr:hypothetical protein JQX13_25125 [Archangium violaceum]
MTVRPIPEGYRTITPGMSVRGANRAVDFFKRAFGAEERNRFALPDGTLVQVEMQLGDSRFVVGEVMPGTQPRQLHAQLFVEDCDAMVQRAVEAGATLREPVTLRSPATPPRRAAARTANSPPPPAGRRATPPRCPRSTGTRPRGSATGLPESRDPAGPAPPASSPWTLPPCRESACTGAG